MVLNVLPDLFKPYKLVDLTLHGQPASDGILFAYGRKGSSLYDLLDGDELSLITQAGQYGFFALYYSQGMAGLLTLMRFKFYEVYKLDWTRQWHYVQKLKSHKPCGFAISF